ncbi:hypothetical protein [Vibrio ziniensis]|uniref:Uncharacterized protein n=1 Tax=Vibrio ziniensis TaxID=2711221 RepID=A0A6G7CMX2_9VIBR|nr:hypothetical protein [Vibrio ziniensis]QIH43452.1 hypothetical protein G5S32_15760 [Vibrio ziniensis]
MSNTLVFDYAVSISEAQNATNVDYSFLNKCLVLVTGSYEEAKSKKSETKPTPKITNKQLKTVQKKFAVVDGRTGKTTTKTRELIDPSQFKVVPVYDPTTVENYTDNKEVAYLMTGGLEKFYLLMLASEVDPENAEAIDFDPTDYFTLCFSTDVDIADAQNLSFADFSGVRAFVTTDKAQAEELAQTDTVFFDEYGSYTGCYEAFGRLLSLPFWRNCQYYVLDSTNTATTIKTVGEADDLFNKRISFFLNGSDGATLGFFGNGNAAITKAYVDRLARLKTQEAITGYIQVNTPNNTSVQRVNIEESAAAVITEYESYPFFYLDSDVDNFINITKSDEQYVVAGKAAIKDAEPIWRANIEVTEAQ